MPGDCLINISCYYHIVVFLLSVSFSSTFSGIAASWNREAPPILGIFLLLKKLRPGRGRCLVQGESNGTGTELGLQITFPTTWLVLAAPPPFPIALWATLNRTLSPCGKSEPCARPHPSPIHGWVHPPPPENEPLVGTRAGIIKHSDSVVDHGLGSQFAPKAPPMTKGPDYQLWGFPVTGQVADLC